MIAFCPNCGLAFQSILAGADSPISFGDNATVSVSGMSEDCPRCGAMAPVGDSVMVIRNGVVELIEADWATPENLRRMGLIVERLRQGRISPKVAEEQAARIDPEAGRKLREWISIGLSFAGTVIAAAALYLSSCTHDPDVSNTQMKEVVESAVQAAVETTLREQMRAAATQQSAQAVSQRFTEAQPKQENRKARRAKKAAEKLKKRPGR